MHVHILGICGTFMGSLALLAKQLGHEVSGSDENVYPPMSTQLEQSGIELRQGYRPENLSPRPDLVIIGNALSRGNPAVEFVLDENINFTSGPQWLAQYVLSDKWVLGVAGTHGKTTTSAILAWILEHAGCKPGYLIGGVTKNFTGSANIGDSRFFVVEADEYDSAFFDKRSKFVHYRPKTAILNNLEFDHADIFPDLAAIQTQFHHLVRTIPGSGLLITPTGDSSIEAVLARGQWTPRQKYGVNVSEEDCRRLVADGQVFWNAEVESPPGRQFNVVKYVQGANGPEEEHARVEWQMTGLHNVKNALAAVAAASHAGVDLNTAATALGLFRGVKRRLELRATVNEIRLYDDFAHHPTAIRLTLEGLQAELRQEKRGGRIVAIIEPRSNTMKSGIHQREMNTSCAAADLIVWFKPDKSGIDFKALIEDSVVPGYAFSSVQEIVRFVEENATPGDSLVVMSNGGFGGIHELLIAALNSEAKA